MNRWGRSEAIGEKRPERPFWLDQDLEVVLE